MDQFWKSCLCHPDRYTWYFIWKTKGMSQCPSYHDVMQNIGAWLGTHGDIFRNIPGVIIPPTQTVCLWLLYFTPQSEWIYKQHRPECPGCGRHQCSGCLSCTFQRLDSCDFSAWGLEHGCSTCAVNPAQLGCADLCTGTPWTCSCSECSFWASRDVSLSDAALALDCLIPGNPK